MVTMYVRDGNGIALTHYCALGNQPRMKAPDATAAKLDFEFTGANGLASSTAAHMHRVSVLVTDADHFSEEWTLQGRWGQTAAPGGEERKATFAFTRVH
jgi:hypothetical protein